MTIEVMNCSLREFYRQMDRDVSEQRISEMMATGQLESLLKDGIKTTALRAYEDEVVQWQNAVDIEETSDRMTEEYPSISAPEYAGAEPHHVPEGKELPEIQWGEDTALIRNRLMGYRAVISYLLIKFDRQGEITRRAKGMGRMLARWEDKKVSAFYNTSHTTNTYDGQPFCDTSGGHPNKTGGVANSNNINGASLGSVTEVALEAAYNQMMTWQGIGGEELMITPIKLIHSFDQTHNVGRVLQSTGSADQPHSGVKNMWQGALQPVLFKRLTKGTWYLFSNELGLIWQWAEKPTVEMELRLAGQSFRNLVNQYRTYEISGFGGVNWRKLMKGN